MACYLYHSQRYTQTQNPHSHRKLFDFYYLGYPFFNKIKTKLLYKFKKFLLK